MAKRKSIWDFQSKEEVEKAIEELWGKIQRDPNWKKLYDILAEM